MPYAKGYYLERTLTPERLSAVLSDETAAVRERVRLCGTAGPIDVMRFVLTADEYDMLRRSMADDRNPGTVTMAALYYALTRGEPCKSATR